MLNVFSWLRNAVRQAVLAGIADAVQQLTSGNADDPSDVGEARLGRLLTEQPAPVDLTPPAPAQEQANGHAAEAPVPAGRSRRK